MRTILFNHFTSAAVATLLLLPAAAAAQSSPQGAQPPGAASPLAGHPVAGRNAKEHVERRISELRVQLRITPAEQQQWDQFANEMRENARDMDQIFIQRAEKLESMTALQNIQS